MKLVDHNQIRSKNQIMVNLDIQKVDHSQLRSTKSKS